MQGVISESIDEAVWWQPVDDLLGCPHPRRAGPHLGGSFTLVRGGEGPMRNQQPKITTHEPATGDITTDRPGKLQLGGRDCRNLS